MNNISATPCLDNGASLWACTLLSVLQKIKTHKRSFFKLEKSKDKWDIGCYQIRCQLNDCQVLLSQINNLPITAFNHPVIYHPYFDLLSKSQTMFKDILNHIGETSAIETSGDKLFIREKDQATVDKLILEDRYASKLAALNSYFYYLKTYLNVPAVAERARKFERSSKEQLAESKVYLKTFFQPEFYFHFVEINLTFTDFFITTTTEPLENIATIRRKLIVDLKNNGIINSFTRYLWRIDISSNNTKQYPLMLNLLLVHRSRQEVVNQPPWSFEKVQEFIKGRVNHSAIFNTNVLYEFTYKQSHDTAKDKRKQFNSCIDAYFDKPIWKGVYVLNNATRKELRIFGKGNDKNE